MNIVPKIVSQSVEKLGRVLGAQPSDIRTPQAPDRFVPSIDCVPVMLWRTGPHSLCQYVNVAFLAFTGRRLEDERGSGWVENVHPKDFDRFTAEFTRACRARTQLRVECRLRRYDGAYRWVSFHGEPAWGDHGFDGYVGSCTDVSRYRKTEQALRDSERRLQTTLAQRGLLFRTLLNTETNERRHLARELHDSVGPDLTSFIMFLRRQQNAGAGTLWIDEGIELVERMLRRVRDLSVDLHPSILDDLGLVAALEWYVERQRELTGLGMRFEPGISDEYLSGEAKMVLFRVVQESVANAVRHSGANSLEVRLSATGSEELELAIADNGSGFDVSAAQSASTTGEKRGLAGMRERVLLLGGELEVSSGRGLGTVVRARLPHGSEARRRKDDR